MHLFNVCNENQLMSLFYSYIAGSLHVSGPQAHLQESSYSCSHNHWTNGCVNSCTNSPEDGPVGPKHVEIQHYTNKIVTSVGFHCICWKDARYKKLKSETSSLQDSWALPVKSTVQEFFTHRLQSVKLHNSSAPCAHNSSTTVLPQPNTQPTNRSTTN